MPVPDLLLEGLKLLILGMGIVYAFLLLLVGILGLMGRLVRSVEGERPGPALVGSPGQAEGEDEVVAAIAAALTLHRARYRSSRQ